MLSGNGSVFRAEETQTYATNRNITLKFNVAEAPWFRGIWEQIVSSVKRCMKKTIRQACLSYSRSLSTLFDGDYEKNAYTKLRALWRKIIYC